MFGTPLPIKNHRFEPIKKYCFLTMLILGGLKVTLGVLKVTMVKLGCFMVMLGVFKVTMVT